MLSIGDLANQTGVSKRTLRHWDAVGLLTPSSVDPHTSYRWYAPSQAGRVHAIVALRTVGFDLDQITDLLGSHLTANRLLELLRTRESELVAQVESASAHLAEVRRRLRSIERGMEMTTTNLQLRPLPGLHFHDLRHTGNTLAAQDGASLGDLMARMGHDSTRAAVIYQHASREADRVIADALSARVEEAQRRDNDETQPQDDEEEDSTDEDGPDDDDGLGGAPAPVG